MEKTEDANTRYYIDLDLKAKRILAWNFDQKEGLAQRLPNPAHHRVFITKGQYHKLDQSHRDLE